MKIAAIPPFLLLAVVMTTTAGGAAAAATDYLPRMATLTDFFGSSWGAASVKLRVESGIFTLKSPGRLRTYPRKYTYTVGNLDFWGGHELVIDRFRPSTCGLRYLAMAPTQLSGDYGEPGAWRPSAWSGPSDRNLSWACTDPYTEGIFPESSFQFELYSEAEPGVGTVAIEGWGVHGVTFMPTEVKTEVLYTVPGCVSAGPAPTPEFDLEAAVSPSQVSPGHVATFTIRARNVGRTPASNARIKMPLSSWLVYLPGSLRRDGVTLDAGAGSPATGILLGTLPPDGTTTAISFQARVAAGVAEGTPFTMVARLTCDQTEALDSTPVVLKAGPTDRDPPAIEISTPVTGSYGEDQEIPFRYAVADIDPGLDPSQTRATLDGKPIENGAVIAPFSLSPGPHTFTVTAVDLVGNRGTRSVTVEVAVTVRSTIQRVLSLRNSGLIRTDQTLSALNTLLLAAKQRLEAGDWAGGLAAIDAFRRTVNSPARRTLIDPAAIEILTASADYLLQHPAP
jgi:uncharacterized repeat protein (TIGR01451 family)